MNQGKSPMRAEQINTRQFLGLSGREWGFMVSVSFSLVILLAPWLNDYRCWIGAGLFFSIAVFLHLCLVAHRQVAFPGLISLAACIQWIIAPWLSELYPSPFPQFHMAIPVEDYLRYALPATIVFWLGLHWPLRGIPLRLVIPSGIPKMGTGWRRVMDVLILAGIILEEIGYRVPNKYSFIVFILGSFRFFAALSWLITRTPGWKFRVAIVLIQLIVRATEQTLFYHFVHWGGYFLLLYGFIRGWRWKLGTALIAAVLVLGVFQFVKMDYRKEIATHETLGPIERMQKLWLLGNDTFSDLQEGEFPAAFGYALVRFNQGWIIARIMGRVPEIVPYARGETLYHAALYSIIPRALDPSKPEGASKELFATFTGISLNPDTSMGLSVIGELYANFGFEGGIAATFIYAWIIGFLFSRLLRLSSKSALWLAIIPLILLPAVDPAWNVEDVFNNIVKVSIVVVSVVFAIPHLRRLLGLQKLNPTRLLASSEGHSKENSRFSSRGSSPEPLNPGFLRSPRKGG